MVNKHLTDEEVIEALRAHGSQRLAAQALGINRRTLQRRIPLLVKRGFSPQHDMKHTVPDGYLVKGVSTYYDRDGNPAGQWVKSQVDRERMQEIMESAVDAMVRDLPKIKARVPKGLYNDQIMACYPLGDPHVGMKAWAEECGENWDLAIAERVHCGVMHDLVMRAPPAEQATIVNLGDLFHYDSQEAVTPRSGHSLDADGRYAKMIDVGILIMRQCIESALQRHRIVRVINVPGNHDPTGALWLSRALSQRYYNEPRVIVDTSPSVFSYFEFGKVLVGTHHGHSCKPNALPGVMAADQPEAWGRTKWRYWWMGHIHHESVKEYPGVLVESFGTLATRDAHATNGGWRSRQQAKCIVLHRDLGEIVRLSSHPAMI